MIPKQIGIHAPYTWDDPTYMACIVADLAMRCEINISYLSSQAHDQQVHYRWDALVRSGKRTDFQAWAYDCSHIIWFDIQKKKLEIAKKMNVKNIIVAMWQRFNKDYYDMLGHYDVVVCPTKACFDVLKNNANLSERTSLLSVNWDSGFPIVDHPMCFGGKRMAVFLNGQTAEDSGQLILNTMRAVMDGDLDFHLTIVHTKNWTRPVLEAVRSLQGLRGRNRTRVIRKPSYSERSEIYATHDWVFLPSINENAGIFALEGLANGRPVIAFNAPPLNEIIRDGHNGCLIGCNLGTGEHGVPHVHVNARDLTEKLLTLADDGHMFKQLFDTAWPELQERKEQFQEKWKYIWNYA